MPGYSTTTLLYNEVVVHLRQGAAAAPDGDVARDASERGWTVVSDELSAILMSAYFASHALRGQEVSDERRLRR